MNQHWQLGSLGFRFQKTLFLLVGLLCLYGIYSFFTLPSQEDPSITIRQAMVTTDHPSFTSNQMEKLITEPLEQKLRTLPEIKDIRSISMPGRSIIHLEIQYQHFDLNRIWDDTRTKLELALPTLPIGTHTPQFNDEMGEVSAFTLALTGKGYRIADRYQYSKTLRNTILRLAGTEKVTILGYPGERIYVDLNTTKMQQLGVSLATIRQMLAAQHTIYAAGSILGPYYRYDIMVSDSPHRLSKLKALIIPTDHGEQTIHLKDIAHIYPGTAEKGIQSVFFNGQPVLMLGVVLSDQTNVVKYKTQLEHVMATFQQHLPAGMKVHLVSDQAEKIQSAVRSVTRSVMQTLFIVLIVVVLFLGRRTGMVVSITVPAVILICLAIMNFSGITLQRMSLATLIIALGLLVDNGIVIAEDFKTRLLKGETRESALIQTPRTLALPLLTSTLTSILVYLPLLLAQHVAGEYTRSISLVILITLSTSWLLAIFVLPVLGYYFIHPDPKKKSKFARIIAVYGKGLTTILHYRKTFIALMVMLFLIALMAFRWLPAKFFPDSDRAQILVYLDLPAGSSEQRTNATLAAIFAQLKQPKRFPYIQQYTAFSAFGGPRFVLSLTPIDPEAHKAFMVIDVDRLSHMDTTIAALRALFHDHFPTIRARVSKMFLGPSDSSVLEVQVRGDNKTALLSVAQQVEQKLRATPHVFDVYNDWENRSLYVQVGINAFQAHRAHMTQQNVAESLRLLFEGEQVSEYYRGDDRIPVIVRVQHHTSDISQLPQSPITNNQQTVFLSQVARTHLQNEYSHINRFNGVRTVKVFAKSDQRSAEDLAAQLQPELDKINRAAPDGIQVHVDGVVRKSREGQAALQANMPFVLALIFIIMLLQFNSFRKTLIILFTIPLSIIGVVIGLAVCQADFGFVALLGIYGLAGIIINNAIVLLEQINIEQRSGQHKNLTMALITACQRRLRPIIITTVTTMIGLLPLMISRDPLFYGMTAVLCFGLLAGTVLTLGFVPALYLCWFGKRK